MTNRTVPALLGCAVTTLLIAGCGSSGATSTSNSKTTSATSVARGAPTPTTESSSTVALPPTKVSGPVHSGLVQVRYQNIAISPATINVRVGTTIKWTNYDMTPHNVTTTGNGATNFSSKDITMGQSFQYKATTPGVIHYLCTIHPASMTGTITVVTK